MTGLVGDIARSRVTGRWLCLLFCNTVENYRLEQLNDALTDFAHWVKWSARHGVISESLARELKSWAEEHPSLAKRALDDAKEFRLRLFRLLSDHALGESPGSDGIGFLNRRMASALSHLRLVEVDSKASLEFVEQISPERLLWPVVYSAVSLLTDAQCSRLRRCGGDKCTWLFIDESKNRSRRWCDMRICGNRAKSRAHYRRTQQAPSR